MAKKTAQFDEFVTVPYRKPSKEQTAAKPPAQPAAVSKKGKNGRQPVASSESTSVQPETSRNPFTSLLSETNANVSSQPTDLPKLEDSAGGSKSSKQKFVPLFTPHGDELQIKLQGRHLCQCMCTRHNLINNCINCGRIVCEQEGSGACFTCGKLVCTLEEADILRKGGLEAEKLRRRIHGAEELTLDFKEMVKLDSTADTSLIKAEAHKDRLLEFDRTAAQRTKIIDDQADYYNENTFMTADQRKAIRDKEKELRAARFTSKLEKNRKFDLDIAGRAFKSQGDEISEMYADPDVASKIFATVDSAQLLQDLESHSSVRSPPAEFQSFEDELAAIPDLPRPSVAKTNIFRVQDAELQEMSDAGMALSIKQPWASFVVQGFKSHEGRNFYTSHRGKLWIASDSKSLPAKDIIQEENLVRVLLNDDSVAFPEQYMTGFLLGCVDLVDCVTQEEYQRQFPGGILEYPYIFLLANPRELERKFPVSGQSKIFSLHRKIHELARRQPTKRPIRVIKS